MITTDNMIWFVIGTLIGYLVTQIYLKARFIRLLNALDNAIEKEQGNKPIKKILKKARYR